VLNAEVDSLGQDVASDSLVHDDTDGVLGDVVNSASLTVVALVWHTLLDGTITLDVYDIASLVDVHVGSQTWHTLVSEFLGKHVTRTASFTVCVRHPGGCGLLVTISKILFFKSQTQEIRRFIGTK